jgi:predicted nucleic acid-binding protein
VELLSALSRRRRQEPTAERRLVAVKREFLNLWEQWSEITALEVVRRHAERLVGTHPLRAADALQIGAALVAAENNPRSITFVTLDRGQARAAEREGFPVLGPD